MAEIEVDTKEYPKMLYKDGKGTVVHNPLEEKAFLKIPPPSAVDTGDGPPAPPVLSVEVPEATKEHMAFLRSRGYEAKTLKSTQIFMENMGTKDLAGFLADFENWKSGKKDDE
jgi:hypothetical protein